jgi:hypothetical protein
MKIKEEVNTKDETKFIFDAGNIIVRNDVKFEEDAGVCFDYFLDQKIIQNPIKKIEISMIYQFEIEDRKAQYDDYFLNKIEEDGLDDEFLTPKSLLALKYSLIESHFSKGNIITKPGWQLSFGLNHWLSDHHRIISHFFKDNKLQEFSSISFMPESEIIYYLDTDFSRRYINPEWREQYVTQNDNSDIRLGDFYELEYADPMEVFQKEFNNPNWYCFPFIGNDFDYNSLYAHAGDVIGYNSIADALHLINNDKVKIMNLSEHHFCLQKGDKLIYTGDNVSYDSENFQKTIAESLNERIEVIEKDDETLISELHKLYENFDQNNWDTKYFHLTTELINRINYPFAAWVKHKVLEKLGGEYRAGQDLRGGPESLKYLKIAAEGGLPEAIKALKEINEDNVFYHPLEH